MPSANPIEALLFDLDGVLVQSMDAHLRSFAEVMTPWSVVPNLADIAGRRTEDAVAALLAPYGCDEATIAEVSRAKRMRAAALLDELGTDLMTPGALDLIEGARERGLLLGICTAGSQRSIDRFLALSRLDRHDFACLLAAEDVIQAKPHPEIYLRACHIVERHPSICAVVEDSPSGMAAAVAAGCPLIVYREPASRVEVDARAMGVAAHLSEVLPFL